MKATASSSTMALQKAAEPDTASFRAKLRVHVDSIWLQTFILFLIIADLVIALPSLVKDEELRHFISLDVVIIYAVVDIIIRMYAFGPIKYFLSILDVLDFLAVVGSFVLYFYGFYVIYPLLIKIVRWVLVARTSYHDVFNSPKKIQTAIRHLHRSNLRGYRDSKYDLDMAYITEHMIIMSRPAARAIHQFSHDCLSDVKNFLDEKHNGCYRIYDLCLYNDSGHDQCPTIMVHGHHSHQDEHHMHHMHPVPPSMHPGTRSPSPPVVSAGHGTPTPHTPHVESHEKSMEKSHLSLHSHHSREFDIDHSRDIGQKEPDALRPNRATKKSIDMDATASMMSLFPPGMHLDTADTPSLQYDTFGDAICNEFAFRHSSVLPLEKLFRFAEHSKQCDVMIVQSTNGLGRCMFMCACLLFYYYPTASLTEIMKYIYSERFEDVHKREYSHSSRYHEHSVSRSHHHHHHHHHHDDEKESEEDIFRKFLPSQTRYLQYFATLILHCYREALNNGEVDREIQGLQQSLMKHMEQIQTHHEQSLMDSNLLNAYGLIEKSKWNFYAKFSEQMLNEQIGVVIKQIGVYNYYEVIDPYVRWEADIFQWIEAENEEDTRFERIDYDIYTYGADTDPGKNSAIIRRGQDVPPKVLQKDFGIRIFKVKHKENKLDEDKPVKRKLKAQLILHSHFLNLDDDHKITFTKSEIDFVAKDVHHRHFPPDFHITIEARILKKKS